VHRDKGGAHFAFAGAEDLGHSWVLQDPREASFRLSPGDDTNAKVCIVMRFCRVFGALEPAKTTSTARSNRALPQVTKLVAAFA
jgi:hypothetical protein